MTVKAVSFVAASGTGKTTLLEKVIAGLKERGYRVGVVKHDAHRFSPRRPTSHLLPLLPLLLLLALLPLVPRPTRQVSRDLTNLRNTKSTQHSSRPLPKT